MGVSRSDRNRSSSQEVTEQVFWEQIDELKKQIRLLQPNSPSSPVIIGHPSNVAATVGGVAVFAVAVTGPGPLLYQWVRDGVDIADATGPTLIITGVTTDDAANYSVRVRNQVGEATSNEAQLTVTTVGADVPIGGILIWSGLLVDIPANYALCDGTGGTPDLRDKFICGAAPAADPGTTGGAVNHKHAAAGLTFTGTAMGDHTHGVASMTMNSVSAGTPAVDNHSSRSDLATGGAATALTGPTTHTGTPLAGHHHNLGGTTDNASAGTPAGTIGGDTANADGRPPFYAVAFIQRIS